MDMLKINKVQPEHNCPYCVLYRKEIDELKEAIIDADVQSVRQQTQLKYEISKSDEDCSYTDELLEDAKAEIRRLKAKRSSGSQSKVLEKVAQPESNTTLRMPDPLNVKDKECDTKYGFTEDKDKSFDSDLAKS